VSPGDLILRLDLIAGLTARAIAVFGNLYGAARYDGLVGIGVGITGLRGSVWGANATSGILLTPHLTCTQDYRRGVYPKADELSTEADARRQASTLVLPLIKQITSNSYDPFHL